VSLVVFVVFAAFHVPCLTFVYVVLFVFSIHAILCTQLLDQFILHPIDTRDDLLDAYLLGHRLRTLLADTIPSHPAYSSSSSSTLPAAAAAFESSDDDDDNDSNSIAVKTVMNEDSSAATHSTASILACEAVAKNMKSREQLETLLCYLSKVSFMIDCQEHQARQSRTALDDHRVDEETTSSTQRRIQLQQPETATARTTTTLATPKGMPVVDTIHDTGFVERSVNRRGIEEEQEQEAGAKRHFDVDRDVLSTSATKSTKMAHHLGVEQQPHQQQQQQHDHTHEQVTMPMVVLDPWPPLLALPSEPVKNHAAAAAAHSFAELNTKDFDTNISGSSSHLCLTPSLSPTNVPKTRNAVTRAATSTADVVIQSLALPSLQEDRQAPPPSSSSAGVVSGEKTKRQVSRALLHRFQRQQQQQQLLRQQSGAVIAAVQKIENRTPTIFNNHNETTSSRDTVADATILAIGSKERRASVAASTTISQGKIQVESSSSISANSAILKRFQKHSAVMIRHHPPPQRKCKRVKQRHSGIVGAPVQQRHQETAVATTSHAPAAAHQDQDETENAERDASWGMVMTRLLQGQQQCAGFGCDGTDNNFDQEGTNPTQQIVQCERINLKQDFFENLLSESSENASPGEEVVATVQEDAPPGETQVEELAPADWKLPPEMQQEDHCLQIERECSGGSPQQQWTDNDDGSNTASRSRSYHVKQCHQAHQQSQTSLTQDATGTYIDMYKIAIPEVASTMESEHQPDIGRMSPFPFPASMDCSSNGKPPRPPDPVAMTVVHHSQSMTSMATTVAETSTPCPSSSPIKSMSALSEKATTSPQPPPPLSSPEKLAAATFTGEVSTSSPPPQPSSVLTPSIPTSLDPLIPEESPEIHAEPQTACLSPVVSFRTAIISPPSFVSSPSSSSSSSSCCPREDNFGDVDEPLRPLLGAGSLRSSYDTYTGKSETARYSNGNYAMESSDANNDSVTITDNKETISSNNNDKTINAMIELSMTYTENNDVINKRDDTASTASSSSTQSDVI
jgi:hypothetical protein